MSKWIQAPDGTYVGGSQWVMAPDGTYVGGSNWTMAPDGTYVGGSLYEFHKGLVSYRYWYRETGH